MRSVGTLAEALGVLGQGGWRPDVVLANPSLPDSEGLATLRALQDAAAGTPVVVSTGIVTEAVRRQLEALGAAATARADRRLAPPRNAFMHQGVAQSLMAYRIETIAEIERVTRDRPPMPPSRGRSTSCSIGWASATRRGCGWRSVSRAAGRPPRSASSRP